MVEANQTMKEWMPILDKYEPVKVLGSGSYGQVIQAKNKLTNQTVAIKRVMGLFEDLIDTKRILREITLLRFMKNQFIVELLDIIYDRDDENFDTIKVLLVECFASKSLDIEHAIDLLMVSKYIERIGDHAVNIAKWVLYAITGQLDIDGGE